MHTVSRITGFYFHGATGMPGRLGRCLRFMAILILLVPSALRAQTTYPVQVNAHLLPPYSLYLSDYYSGTREKLTVTLINRDQFKPSLTVRLRLIITAPGGVRLQTNDNAYIEPIVVETGVPLRLTQEDLEPYFRNENLITQGYLAAGKLPEGAVEFCFQAIEAYTGRALSASTCTRAFITSQKPPLLSLPLNNENIAFREPLNVLFQWTPLHQGLAQVEYEFILKELWDNGMAVQAAFAYSPEIYRETTRSTSLPYGALQPALLPGKRYAWCIRAQAREGMDAVNVFQNDGYSEVRTFTLQDNCVPPGLVNAVAERKTLQLEWPPLPEHIGFTVSYRLKSTTGTANPWKEMQVLEPKTTLYGLQSGGVYEYRVGGFCVPGQPLYTPILEATIPTADSARLAQCGIMPAINLTNQEPLKELKTSEVIMANDYPVTVTKVSGSNGVYSGEGWVIVPWLNDAKIAVDFTSITVNTDRQMIAGYIDAKYDKKEGQIANLDDVFEGGFDVGTVKTGITKIDYEFDFSIPGVEAFSLNDEGDLVITDDTGEPHTVTAEDREGQGNEGNKVVVFPMTVKDKNGNVYQVEKVKETDPATGEEKEVAKATFVGKAGAPLADGSFDPNQLDGDKAVVTFDKGEGIYAFDAWQPWYANVSLIKDKYGDELWEGYRAPWKFLPDGKTDVVRARIQIKDTKLIKPEQVIFKTPEGTEFTAEYHASDQTYTVKLAAGPAGDAQEIYALFPKTKDTYYTLGKLRAATYTAQAYTVVLVPVNDAPVPEQAIRDSLKAIYGPIAVTWTVKKDDSFAYDGNYRLMENSTGLSTYNDAMRALNNGYRAARAGKFDKAANYLFFLKATGSDKINDRDFTGFMPRGAQFGYIFTSEISQPYIPVTVAHELGHGRWKLYHTFDGHYGGYKRGETNNLMDYKNGGILAKWQWDIIGDPAMLVSVFEGDDASANLFATLPKDLLNGNTFNFLTPTGKKLTLPENCSVSFNYGITNPNEVEYPVGYIHSFVVTNEANQKVSYFASISGGIFKGYIDAYGNPYQDKLTTKDNNANVILFAPRKDGIQYIKFSSNAGAYTNNEAVKKYYEFPNPFQDKSLILKTSNTVPYQNIRGLVNHQDQDWTLHQNYLTSQLKYHDGEPEHMLIVKVVELRTAYREVFNNFTDCYDVWSEELEKWVDGGYGYGALMKCVGTFEQTLRDHPERIPLFKEKPVEFYRGFLSDFVSHIGNQSIDKLGFLNSLTLQTTQEEAVRNLRLFSNTEISEITWEKRKIILQVLARKAITNHTEGVAVRMVKHLPSSNKSDLLLALTTVKDADNQSLLIHRYLGQTTDDLNGAEFYEFVNTIHSYANEIYRYDKSPFALGVNRKANRYFSFDPSFWSNKPISIEMSAGGRVTMAFRKQFTANLYDPVEVDPFASVSLHFDDNKSTDQFVMNEGTVYTTSGIMAYALCHSIITDNLEIGGFVVLNTVLIATGIGEINAALAAGRTGGIILGGTDIALGVAAIIVDTKYRGIWKQSASGQTILKFWDLTNLLYAGGRITQALVTSARDAKAAAKVLEAQADDAERVALAETEAQADNILNSKIGDEIRFVESITEVPGLLARHRDLKFIYGGMQKGLGSSYTNFERALNGCTDDVMAVFNKNPQLLYKLGNVENAAEAAIRSKLNDIAKRGTDFGSLSTAGGKVKGIEGAELLSNIRNNTNLLRLNDAFSGLDDASRSVFLSEFGTAGSDILNVFNANTRLVEAWNIMKSTALSSNIDALSIVEKYLSRFPKEGDKIRKFLTDVTEYRWPSGGIGKYPVIESFDKVFSQQLNKVFPQLTGEELVAVHHYSRGISYPFNQAKRGTATITDFFKTFDEFLDRGLSKLPNYSGRVHRGTALPESYVLSKYQNAFKNGTKVSEEAYSSTSKVEDFLKDYMTRNVNPGDVNVIFRIESKTGKDIERISNFGSSFPANVNHKEVLFKPGVEFKVTDFKPVTDANKKVLYYEIFLAE